MIKDAFLAACRSHRFSPSEKVVADELDEVCRIAVAKIMEQTEWLHQELTDEEIKNAMLDLRR